MATLIPPSEDLGLGDGYHSPQLDAKVRLNTNESPLPPPSAWLDDLAAAVSAIDHNRYPDRGYRALRTALAAEHGVSPEQIFVANGSNEVLQTVFLTYGGPSRSVAVFEPTYALHGHIARLTRTEVLVGERDQDFAIPEAELDRVLGEGRPDITMLCSPNNPTGRAEPRDLVEKAMGATAGLLVVDEAYGQFAPWSALDLLTEDGGVAVVRTFSKTWSMAATRLGYLVAPAAMVAALDQVVLPYHLDALKQEAGRLALAHRGEMEDRVSQIVSERRRIEAGLAALEVRAWPSDANFVLFQVNDGPEVWRELADRSVLVRDCHAWPRLAGCLRVTVGTPDENDAFLAALKEIIG